MTKEENWENKTGGELVEKETIKWKNIYVMGGVFALIVIIFFIILLSRSLIKKKK